MVGAGVAGLTAARLLHRAGLEVVVLEARDRLGGRVWTAQADDDPPVRGVQGAVDLGAAWIHGPEGNPVTGFLDHHQLAHDDAPQLSRLLVRDIDGDTVGLEALAEARAFADRLHEAAGVLSAGGDVSVQQAIRRLLDEEGWTGAARRRHTFGAEILMIEVDYAAPVDRISVRSLVDEAFPGADRIPRGGYAAMIRRLAEGLDVRRGHRAVEVVHDAGGVEVQTPRGTFRGSHVIVTVPLGVLQKGGLRFVPDLSAARQQALRRLDMANLEKVVLQFDEPFWQAEGSAFALIDEAVSGASPVCIDFTAHAGAPTLAALAGGRYVRQAWSAMSDEALVASTLEQLAAMLGRSRVPLPNAALVTRWREDPLAGGSYSYVPVGATRADLDRLAEPEGPRVLFAGEHTAGLAASTVHGAMMSGLREAARLGVAGAQPSSSSLPPPHPSRHRLPRPVASTA